MPADGQHLRLARVESARNFVVVGHRINPLLIDFLNHVAFLQIARAGIRIDIGDNNTMDSVRQIKLTRQRRS